MATRKKAGSIQSEGGRARAAALTPAQRSEIARAAAESRWSTTEPSQGSRRTPRATHDGVLKIGDFELPCAVLDDGRRVLTQEAFSRAIGRSGNPYRRPSHDFDLPPFLTAANLKPYISDKLRTSSRPIEFRLRTASGALGARGLGYAAELLPQVCRVFLDARDAGALHHGQHHIARASDILIRGLATVGIVALVDEATGYQYERDRQELQKILAAYISEELLPWTERFPRDFYKEMFRLRGWSFSPLSVRGPRYAGKLTNMLVYDKLPPGVLDELRRKNPANDRGQRKYKHHQFLTDQIGNPHLERQVASVTTLMRAASDWDMFCVLFQRAFPTKGEQMRLELPPSGDLEE